MNIIHLFDYSAKLDSYLLIGAGVFVLIAILVGIIILAQISKRSKKYESKITNAINSCRVFIVDLNEGEYNYFQLNRLAGSYTPRNLLRDSKTLTFQSEAAFYAQFDKDDAPGMRDWINELIYGDGNVAMTRDVYITFSKTKKAALSLLEVLYVSREEKKVYLKSTILKNTEIEIRNKKKIKKAKASNILPSRSEVIRSLQKHSFRGYTFAYKFYYSDEQMENRSLSIYLVKSLFDSIRDKSDKYKFYLCNENDALFTVVDLKVSNKQKAQSVNAIITRKFKQVLGLHGYLHDIDIASFAVKNETYRRKPEALFDASRSVVEAIANNKTEGLIFYNDKYVRDIDTREISFNTQSTIEKDIKYIYEPVVKVCEKSIREVGYFAQVYLADKQLSFRDLRMNCEHDNTLDKLFLVPTHKILQTFNSEIKNAKFFGNLVFKLFLHVRFADNEFFEQAFKNYTGTSRGWGLVIVLLEKELAAYSNPNISLKDRIEDLSSKYELMLLLENNNEIKLEESILKLFSYYTFDLNGIDLHKDEIMNFNITSKAGKLTRYKCPIIMKGITSWPDLQLMANVGIDYLSGPILFPKPTNMIAPLEKKIIDKTMTITNEVK